MTCREMSRTTKEPCGKPLPCADHSTPTNAPESAGMSEDDVFLSAKGLAQMFSDGGYLVSAPRVQDVVEAAMRDVMLALYRRLLPTPAAPQPETEGMTEAERVEIANLAAEINLAIYNTIPNVTLAQVERINVRAILTAAKGGR